MASIRFQAEREVSQPAGHQNRTFGGGAIDGLARVDGKHATESQTPI